VKYHHRFVLKAPLEQVAEFHSRAASMAAITPLPIVVRIQRAPAVLTEGDEMEFTMWLGPFPIHWMARIEQVSSTGFTDRQLQGPFAAWSHRHEFVSVDEHSTEVVDSIALNLRRHPVWWLVGAAMRLGLPVLFAYRAWKTRRLLE
jgi:ligand-binding SRPBCC domain-containing protein